MKISKEVKVGLFMVTAIVLFYLGINFLKGIDFLSSSNKYYVVYQNVDKLTESNQIYLNGYAVGRVKRIQIEQSKNRVLVELNINSDIVLTDSTIAVLNGELLGGRFIQLDIRKSNKILQPNDTLRSDVAKGLMDLFAENAEPVADNLQTTIKKLNTLLDGLTSNSAKLDSMFGSLKNTPVLLNRTLVTVNGNIDNLGTSFKTVAENINDRLNDIKPTLQNFKTLSDSLKSLELNATVTKAKQTIAHLDETIARFHKGDNTLGKLMTEDTLYVNLNKMVKSFDSLANHLNHYPSHFLAPLGKSHSKIEKELREQREEEKKKKNQ
jgi:phospholipid/cholesterol/gamma-HCH transport system substrate-binding protein